VFTGGFGNKSAAVACCQVGGVWSLPAASARLHTDRIDGAPLGHFTVRGAILALIGRRLAFAAVALINFRVIRFLRWTGLKLKPFATTKPALGQY